MKYLYRERSRGVFERDGARPAGAARARLPDGAPPLGAAVAQGPGLPAWGRVAHGRFDGEAPADMGRMRLDGEVLTGTLGADADRGRVLAGVAVSLSEGDGTFDDGKETVRTDLSMQRGAICSGRTGRPAWTLRSRRMRSSCGRSSEKAANSAARPARATPPGSRGCTAKTPTPARRRRLSRPVRQSARHGQEGCGSALTNGPAPAASPRARPRCRWRVGKHQDSGRT